MNKVAKFLVGAGLVAALSIGILVPALANNSGSATGTYLAQTTVVAGDTIASATAVTAFVSSCVIGASQMSVGRTILCVFGGTVSDTATPTLNIGVRDASGSGTPLLWGTGATTLGSGIANLSWQIHVTLTCVTAGASGAIRVTGEGNVGNAAALAPIVGATAIAGTGTIAFDTTIAHTITAEAGWSALSSSNTVTQAFCFPFLGN